MRSVIKRPVIGEANLIPDFDELSHVN
jgi:hypothetical protein